LCEALTDTAAGDRLFVVSFLGKIFAVKVKCFAKLMNGGGIASTIFSKAGIGAKNKMIKWKLRMKVLDEGVVGEVG